MKKLFQTIMLLLLCLCLSSCNNNVENKEKLKPVMKNKMLEMGYKLTEKPIVVTSGIKNTPFFLRREIIGLLAII